MKVKLFDFEHEEDLEKAINDFIEDVDVIDIKYQATHFESKGDQIYSFSCMIIYKNR